MRLYVSGVLLWCASCSLLATPDHVPLPDAGVVAVDGGVVASDPCEPNPCREQLKTQCEALEGEAVCSCDEGATAVGDTCLPSDTCDDGDCPGGAISLARGASIEGTLNRNGGDTTDWYVLSDPSTGGVERVTVTLIGDSGPDAVRDDGESIPIVPNIKIFIAPDLETPARAVPRDGVEDDGQFVRISSLDVPAGAVVLARIDDAEERSVSYRIDAAMTTADDHADGDAQATVAQEGEQAFVLETREDTDTFNLVAERDGALLVSVTLNELAEDPSAISLRIGSVGGNDHRRYYGRARHTLTAGTYSIRVDHRSGRLVSGTLYLRVLSDDDHGDRAEEASPISAGRGEIVSGSLEAEGTDWFAFPAQSNAVYRVVYNGEGTLRGRRVDDADFVWSHAQGDHYRHDGQSGDVVLEVSGAAHDYDLMIMETDLSDTAGNRYTSAEVLADGDSPFAGTLDYRGDTDFFGPLFGDGQGCISWPGVESETLSLSVVDNQGQAVAEVPDQDGNARISFDEPAIYYLRVGVVPGQTAAYPLGYQFGYSMDACD